MAEQRFYVVGGEYADTSFHEPASGTQLEVHGPFSEAEARSFWRAITGKTVDNAMVRYFLKPEGEINGKIYWVVGGEYADSTFTKLAPGKELEVYGPLEKWEAVGFWRGLTSKSVDDALVRYDIRKNFHREDGGIGPVGPKAPRVRTKTKSVAIAVPPRNAFRYLADARNWPRWAIHNIRAIKGGEGSRWDVETPQGPGSLTLETDEQHGVIDHILIDAAGVRWTVPSRIIPGGDNSIVIMTFLKPDGMSESDFASAMSEVDDELSNLRTALESARAG